jgi:hypothetical protein
MTLPAFIRRPALLAGFAALAVVGGCGAESLGPSTAPLADGTEIAPQRYPADVVEAGDAVSDFGAVLARGGTVARRDALLAVAPDLRAALGRVELVQRRLDAARLVDQRLEAQRGRAAALLVPVVSAMRAVAEAAEQGRPGAAAAASEELARATGALRQGAEPTTG